MSRISELIYKCKIKEEDIGTLRGLWNLDIDTQKGEREW